MLYCTVPHCTVLYCTVLYRIVLPQVMFARVNSPMLAQRVPSVLKALQYSKWATAVAAEAVGLTTNSTPRVESECFPWGFCCRVQGCDMVCAGVKALQTPSYKAVHCWWWC
jgi:hypothetical protein